MLSHGVAPTGLLLSTMVPVPKDKRGSKSDSNNYRAIAISSILGKLFDSIIIKDQHLSLTRCTRGDARSFFCTYKTYLYAQN